MNAVEKFLIVLDKSMERPHSYGWFHIMFIILTIISILFIYFKYKNNEKFGKNLILILSIIMLSFEVYKQINFSFNYNEFSTWWEYLWYAFPFQFCSTPMYIGLIASLSKNLKIKNSMYYFLALYGIIGGLITLIYPESCFVKTIGINIQTMVHHSSMIIMGITVPICLNLKFNIKSFISATKVFLTLVLMAIALNIATYYLHIDNGLEMFYISPFHNCSLPILSIIDEKLSYIPFLIIYLIIFLLGSLSITYIIKRSKNR